jgi:hypothetical protein
MSSTPLTKTSIAIATVSARDNLAKILLKISDAIFRPCQSFPSALLNPRDLLSQYPFIRKATCRRLLIRFGPVLPKGSISSSSYQVAALGAR